ncbi:MAG: HelD family protein [Acidimicrobiales bacterium]
MDPDPEDPDPILAEEQRHLDHAHACLDHMRATTERLISTVDAGATAADSEVSAYHLRKRAASYDSRAPLAFGRLDTDDSDTFHVGRRHVEDPEGDPVVVDWRAPVSAPFYRATWRDPLGLTLRRRFSIDGRTIVALHDEDFTDPDSVGGGGIPDPLLAELERSRTGEMRDIVATIQAEQDEIIRAPLDQLTVVQGGPGSGKTAVGLHRAAFLLYEHRLLLEEKRVLIIGPNRVFLRYISEVLPSLGETAVVQTTIEDLLGARYRVRATEPDAVSRLKGDARLAEVLRRTLLATVTPPTEDAELHLPWGRVRLTADDIGAAVAAASARALDFTAAREVFRSLLARRVEALLLPQFRGEAPAGSDFIADAKADATVKRIIARTWPAASAPALVRRVLGNRRAAAAASAGLLDPDELALLHRRPAKKVDDEQWTAADIPLLDEADALIGGVRATYGHIVVDEAQDLSAMALRMVARRSPGGSVTVLGDLAQSTAPGGQDRWEDAIDHLGTPTAHVVAALEIGYRVPAPVLDYASRLLPLAAPHVRPSRSIRTAGDDPWVTAAEDGPALLSAVVERSRVLAAEWGSVGVVAPRSLTTFVLDALRRADLDAAPADRGGLDRAIAVLDPPTAKGLEFDAVIVVEPSAFLREEDRGARLLYIAMTRCVQHLSVIHAESLPEALSP